MKIRVFMEYIDNDGWHLFDSVLLEGDAIVVTRLAQTAFESMCWKFLQTEVRGNFDAIRPRFVSEA